MVNYHLRNDLRNLRVCLYNPNGESIDKKFTTDSLSNYISDCYWQIFNGETVQRFPYHISPVVVDAKRAEDEMKSRLLELRKEINPGTDHTEEKPTEKRRSWGYGGGKNSP